MIKCATCLSEAKVHVGSLDIYFCMACIDKIDRRIAALKDEGKFSPDPFLDLVRKHQLAVENLTESQLAEAIRQAIASGDFVRQVVVDNNRLVTRQAVIYVPWAEAERIRALYNELVYAVVRKHEGETCHQTALRYIMEAEKRATKGTEQAKSNPPEKNPELQTAS